ncbi:MAG TPA: hypothetical protein VH951_05980 [Dehalococcoidia bacterium]
MNAFTDAEIRHMNRGLEATGPRPRHVNIEYLVRSWTHFVDEVESGYKLTIYDYTNDLSKREILHELSEAVGPTLSARLEEVLRPVDERFRAASRALSRPVSRRECDEVLWWNFLIPTELHGELLEDLQRAGLLG